MGKSLVSLFYFLLFFSRCLSKTLLQGVKNTYRSTNPCPTRYPKLSNRKCTASNSSSSSILRPPDPAPAPVELRRLRVLDGDSVTAAAAVDDVVGVVVVSAASREAEASLSWDTRYASGTSSMRRKSRHEELRKLALGSEAL